MLDYLYTALNIAVKQTLVTKPSVFGVPSVGIGCVDDDHCIPLQVRDTVWANDFMHNAGKPVRCIASYDPRDVVI